VRGVGGLEGLVGCCAPGGAGGVAWGLLGRRGYHGGPAPRHRCEAAGPLQGLLPWPGAGACLAAWLALHAPTHAPRAPQPPRLLPPPPRLQVAFRFVPSREGFLGQLGGGEQLMPDMAAFSATFGGLLEQVHAFIVSGPGWQGLLAASRA
jgi:hypothetical protein